MLGSVFAVLLVVHNLERRAQHDLDTVLVFDYSVYDTSVSDFETTVLSLLAYCLETSGDSLLPSARQGLKELRTLDVKDRVCEKRLADKGVAEPQIVTLVEKLQVNKSYSMTKSHVRVIR